MRILARAVADGRIDVSSRADRERTTAALLELPGFGPWTVAYIAMRALRVMHYENPATVNSAVLDFIARH